MRLWSVSTTVRNPERIRSFLKVLKGLEGEVWNNEVQKKYQILTSTVSRLICLTQGKSLNGVYLTGARRAVRWRTVDAELVDLIREIQRTYQRRYGSPRVREELREAGKSQESGPVDAGTGPERPSETEVHSPDQLEPRA
jgi:hypothetical protein